jgi:hypothetical protein
MEGPSGPFIAFGYFDFFCFLAARFSFRFFLGSFLALFPPLSLLAISPPPCALPFVRVVVCA